MIFTFGKENRWKNAIFMAIYFFIIAFITIFFAYLISCFFIQYKEWSIQYKEWIIELLIRVLIITIIGFIFGLFQKSKTTLEFDSEYLTIHNDLSFTDVRYLVYYKDIKKVRYSRIFKLIGFNRVFIKTKYFKCNGKQKKFAISMPIILLNMTNKLQTNEIMECLREKIPDKF